jgi:hypothetical protein
MLPLLLPLLLSFYSTLTTATDSSNKFLNPQPDRTTTPDYPVWTLHDIQTIEWVTDMVVSNLSILAGEYSA